MNLKIHGKKIIVYRALATAVFVSLCASAWSAEADFNRKSLKLMSYNVENLFDLDHDDGKEDWAYLPLAFKRNNPEVQEACKRVPNPLMRFECFNLDWTREVLNSKVKNIGSVISSSFEGQGPDIILLQEIENIKSLQELQKNGLRNKGYNHLVLIEGPDTRGIDVAILSKIPPISTRSHRVELPRKDNGSEARPTRDILEATFQIGNKKLTVFSNHWPSQSNPTANRVAAARTLVDAAKAASNRGEIIIAMGDFNSLENEIQGPVGQIINTEFVDGIEHRLEKMDTKTQMPGTHWYQGKWSFLDRFYVGHDSERAGLRVKWDTLDIHAPDFALRIHEYRRRDGSVERTQVPYRFDARQRGGYSDHLPLVVELSL
jgi:endonuclease/exonuclease/phosphatase family metal-dependent hydrolase